MQGISVVGKAFRITMAHIWSSLGHPGTLLGPKTYKERHFHPGTWSVSPSSWDEPHSSNNSSTVCFYYVFWESSCHLPCSGPRLDWHLDLLWISSDIIRLTRLGANHKFMNYSCIMLHLLSEHLISHLPRWLSHWASKHWSFPLVDRSWPESRKVRIQHDAWNQEFSTKFYGTRPSVEMVKMSTSYMFIFILYVGISWHILAILDIIYIYIIYIYNNYIIIIYSKLYSHVSAPTVWQKTTPQRLGLGSQRNPTAAPPGRGKLTLGCWPGVTRITCRLKNMVDRSSTSFNGLV